MGTDCIKMGGNGNVKTHSWSSLIHYVYSKFYAALRLDLQKLWTFYLSNRI